MKQARLADGEPAPVPRTVHDCLNEMREAGLTNTNTLGGAAEIARSMGRPETAIWIRDNPALYVRGVF